MPRLLLKRFQMTAPLHGPPLTVPKLWSDAGKNVLADSWRQPQSCLATCYINLLEADCKTLTSNGPMRGVYDCAQLAWELVSLESAF